MLEKGRHIKNPLLVDRPIGWRSQAPEHFRPNLDQAPKRFGGGGGVRESEQKGKRIPTHRLTGSQLKRI
jgi:hypothetical protein